LFQEGAKEVVIIYRRRGGCDGVEEGFQDGAVYDGEVLISFRSNLVVQEQGWDESIEVRFQGAEAEIQKVTQIRLEARVIRVLGELQLQVLVEVEGVMAIKRV
jgi:hypothetical protein